MYKALVVDDNGVSPPLKRGLRDRGYSLVWRQHPSQAMDLLQGGLMPKLVISDVDEHPDYNGIEFVTRAKGHLPDDVRVFLWSGRLGGGSQNKDVIPYTNGPLDVQVHDLYLNNIVDGYAPKIPPTGTAKVMLDLVDSPSFLLFVAKYGAPSFRDLDEETLCRLAQHEIFMKTGLKLSFGDRPLVPALPIFIPPYF